MKKSVLNKISNQKQYLLLFAAGIASLFASAQGGPAPTPAPAPELVFKNPVLVNGTALKEGATYRFPNVAAGVDAEVKLRKFSRNDIVMTNIDLPGMGWDKAFQPQFGLPGLVQPWQHWYIDFEMTFFEAGKSKRQKMSKIDLTALDVDGDGRSISEYVTYDNPSSVVYSTVSYLTTTTVGTIGQSFMCQCGTASTLMQCNPCNGVGYIGNNSVECTVCEGSGKRHTVCNHAYTGGTGTSLVGPVENFLNIDTLATQVMATYQYVNTDRLKFRYGGRSSALSSNGSGIRLNSTWFRQFSLEPAIALPLKMSDFTTLYKGGDVTLNWTTASEDRLSHFIIQRSNDGKIYHDIASVLAVGNLGQTRNYTYLDNSVISTSGLTYYRILCVDQTEEFTYSAVRMIRLAKDMQSIALTTYPNPVADQIKVTLPANWQGKKVSLELYSANGVRIHAIHFNSASQTETMQIGNQSKGFYLVKATCEEQVAQQRVVKN